LKKVSGTLRTFKLRPVPQVRKVPDAFFNRLAKARTDEDRAMCLGVPGRVVRWLSREELTAEAEIDFGGVRKRCHMACVPEATEGDYVLVHAGIALAVLQPESVVSEAPLEPQP
jgi:hydrogenase expression/formation protein HypC